LEYAHLLTAPSKTGAGVQADVDWGQLDRCFDPVLVLEGDKGYAEHLGSRMWLRILNHGNEWHDAANWAHHTVDEIRQVYWRGVRKVQFINEPNLESEGAVGYEDYQVGNETRRRATIETYAFLERWGQEYFPRVRNLLAQAGMADVLLCGPAMSPGHNESEDFRGYGHMPTFLRCCDILVFHSYWHRDPATFLGGNDAIWFAQRLDLDLAYLHELGIEQPVSLSEYNSDGLDFANQVDMALYYEQIKRFNQWLNSKPEVVGQFYFLAFENDTAFYGLSLENMPGAWDALASFDRQSEGQWALPIWTPPDVPVLDEPVTTPEPEGGNVLTEEQRAGILAALDDCWGVLNRMDEQADQAKADVARIRAQIIAVKEAAGLNSPLG
jgi:hypothetical protein